MSNTYSIHKEIINTIFIKLLDDKAFVTKENISSVGKILLRECSDSTIETIIHLMLSEKEYKPLKVGDHVKIETPAYHIGNEYEIDILDDLGLLPKEKGHVYGIVTGDSSWSSTDPFNPFYSRIKIDCLYHDADKKLKLYQHEVNPLQCVKVNRGNIPYYKKKAASVEVVDPITL